MRFVRAPLPCSHRRRPFPLPYNPRFLLLLGVVNAPAPLQDILEEPGAQCATCPQKHGGDHAPAPSVDNLILPAGSRAGGDAPPTPIVSSSLFLHHE